MRKHLIFPVIITLWLVGCGQIITPPPNVTSTPVALNPSDTPPATVTPRATFTPAPATPAPTATPTVTPTPIIYRVQSGDTLLAIAAKFGITAEQIQEANGIVDPRRLQIEQELIIPRPEEDPEQPPTSTPTPPPMTIRGLHFQHTPVGSLWALGEVYNPGAGPLSEVMVQVSLFDEAGQPLASQSAFPHLDVILPGQAVSFSILFTDPPTQFAQYQAVVLSGVPMSPNTRYYLDLTPSALQGQVVDATRYRVSGELQNVGASDAEDVRLVVTAYDDQQRVIAVRQLETSVSVLRSAATLPFELELTVAGSSVVTYSIQAQGLRVE